MNPAEENPYLARAGLDLAQRGPGLLSRALKHSLLNGDIERQRFVVRRVNRPLPFISTNIPLCSSTMSTSIRRHTHTEPWFQHFNARPSQQHSTMRSWPEHEGYKFPTVSSRTCAYGIAHSKRKLLAKLVTRRSPSINTRLKRVPVFLHYNIPTSLAAVTILTRYTDQSLHASPHPHRRNLSIYTITNWTKSITSSTPRSSVELPKFHARCIQSLSNSS